MPSISSLGDSAAIVGLDGNGNFWDDFWNVTTNQILIYVLIAVLIVAFLLLMVVICVYCNCFNEDIPKESKKKPIIETNRTKDEIMSEVVDMYEPKEATSASKRSKASNMDVKVQEMYDLLNTKTKGTAKDKPIEAEETAQKSEYEEMDGTKDPNKSVNEKSKFLSTSAVSQKPDSKYESKAPAVSQMQGKASNVSRVGQTSNASQVSTATEDRVRQLLSLGPTQAQPSSADDDRVRQLLSISPKEKKRKSSGKRNPKVDKSPKD